MISAQRKVYLQVKLILFDLILDPGDIFTSKIEQQENTIHELKSQYDKILKIKDDLLAKLEAKSQHEPMSSLFPEPPQKTGVESPFYRDVFSLDLPPSSIYCTSAERENR